MSLKVHCPTCRRDSSLLTARCSSCGESFDEREVVFLESGADVCPRCKTENMTCAICEHCGAGLP